MKYRIIYLIACLLLFGAFSFAGMRGFRVLTILSVNAWTHSVVAPVHK